MWDTKNHPNVHRNENIKTLNFMNYVVNGLRRGFHDKNENRIDSHIYHDPHKKGP